MPSINVSLSNNSENTVEGTICQSRICGHRVEGTNCGSDISEWLSLALVLPNLKLVKQSDYENTTGIKIGNLKQLHYLTTSSFYR